MSSCELVLADFNTLCTKAEGRDKIARICQYGARTIVGLIASFAAPKAGTSLSKLEGHARTVMTQLAGARRTHRWCKEIPVIQSLPKCLEIQDPVDRAFELMQKVSLAVFMMIDHVGQLKQWKILPGGRRSGTGTVQLGLKFFCLSNFVGCLYQMKKARALAAKEKPAEAQKCRETAFKHALLVLQTAHLSRLYESKDWLVGIAGVITSSMDVLAQLPARPPPKVSPDAKGKVK